MPLILAEHPAPEPANPDADSPLPFAWSKPGPTAGRFPAWSLEDRLAWGSLPGVVAADEVDRGRMLHAFAAVHLEEEMRREAFVKDWGAFLRFLRLAAVESGQTVNYAAIAQQTGLSLPTLKNHYQLLEDMFIGVAVPAWSRSRRKNLMSAGKFLIFDLGVRHAAAGLRPTHDTVLADPGPVFEQWVGLELWRRLQYLGDGGLHYLRSYDGAEVDYIVEHNGELTPVEVKWTDRPSLADGRHLLAFLAENKRKARRGVIVCRCSRPLKLHDQVTAVPWFCLWIRFRLRRLRRRLQQSGDRAGWQGFSAVMAVLLAAVTRSWPQLPRGFRSGNLRLARRVFSVGWIALYSRSDRSSAGRMMQEK